MKTGNGKTGRPIGFDRDAALEGAMLLLGERGFEGASMADLTRAMGLNPSSIYAAFGDKRLVLTFSEALYGDPSAIRNEGFRVADLKKVVRALFDNTVEFLTMPGDPPTFLTLGAVGCSVDAALARDLMTETRKQKEAAMRERFLRARRSGELSKDLNVEDYTRYLPTILAGLSIEAA